MRFVVKVGMGMRADPGGATAAGSPPDIDGIRRAAARIAPYIRRTPVLRCRGIDEITGARLFFKCENFQTVGAFKFRGAVNAVFSLEQEEIDRGVATHSSGNHAAALTRAAALRKGRTTVVMPENASAAKRAAVLHYGGDIVPCAPDQHSREQALARIVAEKGCVPIPPFDDYRVIAGQGTAALELLAQAKGLDAVLVPVGGGGLLSGSAIAVSGVSPGTRVFGAEPAAVDDAYRSLRAGCILPVKTTDTIADGLRTTVGELTFPIIQAQVSGILCVEEHEIIAAMRLVWERMKILIEPSAAVPLAAVIRESGTFRGQRVGVILSGGNVDLDALPWK